MSTNDTPTPPATDEQRPAPSLPEDMLIVLPVRNMVLFPGVILPVAIKREKTVAGAQEAMRTEARVGSLLQRDPETDDPGFDELHRVGTVARIVRYITAPDPVEGHLPLITPWSAERRGRPDEVGRPCRLSNLCHALVENTTRKVEVRTQDPRIGSLRA